MRAWQSLLVCVVCAMGSVAGCTDPPVNPDASDTRTDTVERADSVVICTSNAECNDGQFCNGVEVCMPGAMGADARGCVAANPARGCPVNQGCDEATDMCLTTCPDRDNDGHRDRACGGTNDDCDDNDPARFPGNVEVCDGQGHDEDCDPCTVSGSTDGDGDNDGFVSSGCANRYDGTAPMCDMNRLLLRGAQRRVEGRDCDDTASSVRPAQVETCNNVDDNCDGSTDEGLTLQNYYADCDGDNFGDTRASAARLCGVPSTPPTCALGGRPQWVTNNTDCNDLSPMVNPGSMEICNNLDDNCSGTTDEGLTFLPYVADCDGDGHGDPRATAVQLCAPPTVAPNCATGLLPRWSQQSVGDDCNDQQISVFPGAPELCNAIDDNCTGVTDENIATVDFYPDCDRDDFGRTATPVRGCIAPTIVVPGCAMGQTGRWSTRTGDCDDANAVRNPGQIEVCNGIDDDCDMQLDGPDEDVDGDGHANNNCAGTAGSDCDDRLATVFVGATELCDRIDNNCSVTGHARVGGGQPVNFDQVEEDVDNDGASATTAMCTGGPLPKTDCDDNDDQRVPTRIETCDGKDNDCDNILDEGTSGVPGSVCLAAKLRAGGSSICAVQDQTAYCWGNNSTGQAGNVLVSTTPPGPVPVQGATDVLELEVGESFACAIHSDGRVRCWGSGTDGQLGSVVTTSASPPLAVSSALPTPIGLSLGRAHACAWTSSGEVYCWGSNSNGQLGPGVTGATTTTPTRVTGLPTTVTKVEAGFLHTCALAAGQVYCWGNNAQLQCGNNSGATTTTPTVVAGLSSVVEVAAGLISTCARRSTGTVACWGTNPNGELGNNTTTTSAAPVNVSNLSDAVQIAMGPNSLYACALRQTGEVVCWGSNASGQIGDGSTMDRLVPTSTGVLDAVALTTGSGFVCAQRRGGQVMCWGDNSARQLGDGTTTTRTTPTQNRYFGGVIAVATSTGAEFAPDAGHTCAINFDNRVWCWGSNARGQLGNGGTTPSQVPVRSTFAQPVRQVSAGGTHTCALTNTGNVYCWGDNTYGALGNEATSTTAVTSAVQVTALSNVTQVSAGTDFTCAVTASQQMYCWGRNRYGVIADGTINNLRLTPTRVPIAGVVEIRANVNHVCARVTTGAVRCWGANALGQLGNGDMTMASQYSPSTVVGLQNASSLSAGGRHTCAIVANAVMCWGDNTYGQLGLNDPMGVTRLTATTLPVVGDALAIDGGYYHTCLLRSNGSVWCMGRNDQGQLGTGTIMDLLVPTIVPGAFARSLSVGPAHTCLLGVTRGIFCFGDNANGQLGIGNTTDSTVPTPVPSLP